MSYSKTALRIGLGAVALPGVIAGVAAPAASAAELPTAQKSVESHVSEAQHTSFADAKSSAKSTATKQTAVAQKQAATAQKQAASQQSTVSHAAHSDVLGSNTINGKSLSV